MNTFPLPNYADVSALNQRYFEFFKEQLGGLPNLYAMLAYSDSALESYLSFHHRPQSLTALEQEIIGLVVGAFNESAYCLETHTMIARLNGLSDEQIMEVKKGAAPFDHRYHVLTQLVYNILTTKGHPEEQQFVHFFEAGYTRENLVDTLLCIGDNTVTNLLTCSMNVPSDFHAA